MECLFPWSSGSSLEFPPNIDFYRNTLEHEGQASATRPSMMELVEGLKKQQQQQQQQQRQESIYNVELFRERNVEILEGQQRALGKLRNQPRRSESDSSKANPIYRLFSIFSCLRGISFP
jgi:hypothetical protein